MRLRKEPLLVGALVVLLTLGFVLRNFPFTSGRLHEDVLPDKSTNDAFWHQDYGDWVIRSQDGSFLPPHWAEGRTNAYSFYTTVPYLLIAGLAQFTTIPSYQMVFLVFNLLAVFQAGVLFVLVRRLFNAEMAILATALSLFPVNTAWLFQQYIGFFYDLYAYLFVLALLFFLISFVQRPTWRTAALMGVFLAAQLYSHVVEMFFFLPFLLGAAGFFFIRRRLDWQLFAKTAAIGVVLVLVSAYYVPMLFGWGGLATTQAFSTDVFGGAREKPGYFPDFSLPPSVWVLLLLGLCIYLIAKHPAEKRTPNFVFLAFIAYWFLVTKSFLLGMMAQRAYRQLMSGYGLFLVLVAYAAFILVDSAGKRFKMRAFRLPILLALSALVVVSSFSPLYASLAQVNLNSFIDAERWDAVSWVRKNTPTDATLFTLNGYLHSVGDKFSQRPGMKGDVNMGDNIQNIVNICEGMQKGTLPETYLAVCPIYDLTGTFSFPVERTGLLTYRWENSTYCNLPHYVTAEGKQSDSLLFPLEHVDYVLLQFRDTDPFIGQNYDACMQFFVEKGQEEGLFKLVYPNAEHPNSKMGVLKVNKDG